VRAAKALRAFLVRAAALFGQERRDRELSDELEGHLQIATDEGVRSGLDPAEARRRAALQLGGVEQVTEVYRHRRSLPLVESARQDVRYALRSLAHAPSFTLVAVATLAIGIGAGATVWSVADAVLMRPLPYLAPERLVRVTVTNPLKGWVAGTAAPANFLDWRRLNQSFTDLAGYQQGEAHLTGHGDPQRLRSLNVTGNLLDVLGVAPRLGRGFTFDETFEGASDVVVLTHDAWHSLFADDPAIVGRALSLNGRTVRVVGVMPPGFFFPGRDVQILRPLGSKRADFEARRRAHFLAVVGRLRDGVSLADARADLTRIAAELERTYPDTNTQMGVRLDGYHGALAETERPALLLLLAAVAVLFLAVCANVANLQLGRAATRAREFAIRHAMGAGRGRLVRQVLTEGICLSLAGGLLGLLLAASGQAALAELLPQALPAFAELRLDGRVLAFALVASLVAPVVFGLGPALASSNQTALRERSASGSAGPLRAVLVAAEVAACVVLVAGAALLAQSLYRLGAVEPGFAPERATSFAVALPQVRYPEDARKVAAVAEIERGLRALPGVASVGAAARLPLRGHVYTNDATVEGRGGDDYERELRHNFATPGYFDAVGATIVSGRAFTEADDAQAPPVAVVNRALERRYFRGASAVGKRVKYGRPQDADPWVTIVGVVADQRQDALDREPQPEAFTPLAQEASGRVSFVVRGPADAGALAAGARAAVRGFDEELAVTDLAPLDDLVRGSLGDQRFRTILLVAFASVALLLAALGVYGVLAYTVASRTRELGVRLAVGAPRGRLFAMVVRDGLRPVALGVAAGLPLAFAGAVLGRSLLFGIAPADPLTYAATVAVLGTVALLACLVPAARATRVDPLVCLRED
jgi:putative ABC transport system permease protein